MERASAAETLNFGLISGRIKPKALKRDIYDFFQNLVGGSLTQNQLIKSINTFKILSLSLIRATRRKKM